MRFVFYCVFCVCVLHRTMVSSQQSLLLQGRVQEQDMWLHPSQHGEQSGSSTAGHYLVCCVGLRVRVSDALLSFRRQHKFHFFPAELLASR